MTEVFNFTLFSCSHDTPLNSSKFLSKLIKNSTLNFENETLRSRRRGVAGATYQHKIRNVYIKSQGYETKLAFY